MVAVVMKELKSKYSILKIADIRTFHILYEIEMLHIQRKEQ